MFIGVYKINNEIHNNIYLKNNGFGYLSWIEDTFNPTTEIIGILDFKIGGKDYQEKRNNLKDLAIEWQTIFSQYNWSYGELMSIENYFYENGKRYGLLKEFKENCIC